MWWNGCTCLGAVFLGSGFLLAGYPPEPGDAAARQAAFAALVHAIKTKETPPLYAALRQTRLLKAESAAIPLLLDVLREDLDPRGRELAHLALSRIGSRAKNAAPGLREKLKGGSMEDRAWVAIAVSWIEPSPTDELVTSLTEGLRDGKVRTRQEAAYALGAAGVEGAVADLGTTLGDPSSAVRQSAALGLGLLGQMAKGSVTALRRASRDKEPAVAVPAAALLVADPSELSRALPVLVAGLQHNDEWVRRQAITGLAQTPPDAPEAKVLPAALGRALQASEAPVRETAALALSAFGAKAAGQVPAIQALLKNASLECRLAAAVALSYLDPRKAPQGIPVLREGLRHADDTRRADSAGVLGRIGMPSTDAVTDLLPALKDEDASVRTEAALALGRIRDKRALAGLLEAVKDENTAVRALAAAALIDHRDLLEVKNLAIPALLEGLKQKDPAVRATAATVLALFGTEAREASPALLQAMNEGDPDLRAAAAVALTAVGGKQAKEQAIPILIETLKHPIPQYRVIAANALGQLGSAARKAVPALTEALGDKDRRVHTAAAAALAAIGS